MSRKITMPGLGKIGGGAQTQLKKALDKLAITKPVGGHRGGIVMDTPMEEEEIGARVGMRNRGLNPGGTVMEGVPEEEEPMECEALLGKLSYQICEDDIQRLKSNRAVSMVSQNILAQSLGQGFAGKNQNALVKQSKKSF